MERVKSKHLFNFKLEGKKDPQLAELEESMKEMYPKELWDMTNKSCQEVSEIIKKGLEALKVGLDNNKAFQEENEACVHTKFEVPPRDGNDVSVPVLVHTPKTLEGKKNRAAVIYAHGGGAVSGEAEIFQPYASNLAVTCDVVYFNVDYRLAPETKCPYNVLDFYCAIKHIAENASDLGIDASKIAIQGESGGGYIMCGAMVMLAQKNEGNLVKLAISAVAMVDDYEFGDPMSMTNEERENHTAMKKIWECIATDIDAQRKNADPLLFPAKASEELLKKFPPIIVWEFEFDFYITSNIRMATRLRAAGRLLELYILPGGLHMTAFNPRFKICQENLNNFKLAIDTYLK